MKETEGEGKGRGKGERERWGDNKREFRKLFLRVVFHDLILSVYTSLAVTQQLTRGASLFVCCSCNNNHTIIIRVLVSPRIQELACAVGICCS